MATRVDAKWRGDEASKAIKDRLHSRLEKSLQLLVNETKIQLPVLTGKLRDSVQYNIDGLRGSWGSDVEYASAVEFGEEGRSPDGTWRRVTEQNKGNIKEILKGKSNL